MRVFCDITDILIFLTINTSVTGIQRVVTKLVLEVSHPDHPFHSSVVWCSISSSTGDVMELSQSEVLLLVESIETSKATRASLDRTIAAINAAAKSANLRSDDVYLVLGAFWCVPHLIGAVSTLRSEGVRVGALFYDLIPVTHPEYCEQALTRRFRSDVDGLLANIDFATTISAHVAHDVEAYNAQRYGDALPVTPVPLALESVDRQDAAPGTRAHPRPYVLSVGTLEARKNHVYLFQVWRELLARHGPERTPDLVLLGRPGWRIADFMAQLEATGRLDGKIRIVSDADDQTLAALYRDCLFTMFVSHVEGWGLPVGESLAYGKPCICARNSSLPEVGGDLATYIDPLNVREGVAACEAWLLHPDALAEATRWVESGFRARTWRDVSDGLFAAVARMAALPRRAVSRVVLRERTWLRFGNGQLGLHMLPRSQPSIVAFDACVAGWLSAEEWGVWATKPKAELEFRLVPGRYVMVFVLHNPPEIEQQISVSRGDDIYFSGKVSGVKMQIPLELSTNADGVMSLTFQTELNSPHGGRDLRVGLSRMFVYKTDSLEERVMGMQDLNLQSLPL